MKPTFTYRGIPIVYWRESDFWTGYPHFYGNEDPDDFNGTAKTLKHVMEAIDEHLAEYGDE
jgi:hypothetical protein